MPVLISEMRTGSTFASEVISHTLFDVPFRYVTEEEWLQSLSSVLAESQDHLVKMHHIDFSFLMDHLNEADKVFVTVRDPLDAYLSAIYKYSYAIGVSVEDTIDHFEQSNWVEGMFSRMCSFMLNPHRQIALLPYEHFIDSPEIAFSSAMKELEIAYDQSLLSANSQNYSFERKTGRPTGSEEPNAHERNGTVGQWIHCGLDEVVEKRALSARYHDWLYSHLSSFSG